MIPFNKPYFSGKETQYIEEAVKNGKISGNGDFTKKCHSFFEERYKFKKCLLTTSCTDALEMAAILINIQPGDEVIVPSYNFVSSALAFVRQGAKIIFADSYENNPNIDANKIESLITTKTKAIVPVHLYGQSSDMESIMKLAEKYNLYVIEDNAQAIGADYTFSDGRIAKTGTIGHIGSTSFFPSKNLGCCGDGGALMTNDDDLAKKMRMIANHGQEKKYYHKVLGCNSRLDTIQAAILNVKIKHLDLYSQARNAMASFYDAAFVEVDELEIPERQLNSTHVFHQYTLKVKNGKRNELQKYLSEKGIPSMIYYPLPLYKQEAFQQFVTTDFKLPNTEELCDQVLSLPIHTEMNIDKMNFICSSVQSFFIK